MKLKLKLINNSKFKFFIILTFLFSLYVFLCAYSYVHAISTNISDVIFRLHIIANSDSQEDQELKYKVRDNLLEYMNSICTNISTKEEAINIIKQNLSTFKEIASNTITSEGFSYDVNIEIGNFEFPTKTYGDITLPAGTYDALKVEIGKTKGQNWWCVMFPPLCFIDISSGILDDSSKDFLKNNLNEEEYSLISDTSSQTINFKFKLLEFFFN